MAKKDARPAVTAEKHRLQAVRLYEQGWKQKDIAAHLKVSQATVSRDLKVVEKRTIASANNERRRQLAREKAVADYVEKEAQMAWEGDAEAQVEAMKDPRLLKLMLESSDRRAKLFGLIVDKIDHTTQGERITLSAEKMLELQRQAQAEVAKFEAELLGDGSDG